MSQPQGVEVENEDVVSTVEDAAPPKKFLVLVPSPDGGVVIRIEGMDMDAARKVIAIGHIRFEQEYDAYLRRTIK
jgi:hypothetical protein